ncbi:MAG: GDSL-type esterase/lipase family protein [Candidatus Omnitrophota bacterium]
MRKFLLIIFGIIICFIVVECALCVLGIVYKKICVPEYDITCKNKDDFTIICLGDSFTYGTGAGPENSWPVQLEYILNRNKKEKSFRVLNLGYPDFTSAMALRKFKESFPVLNPDMVVIMIGRSDAWSLPEKMANGPDFFSQVTSVYLKLKTVKLIKIISENIKGAIKKHAAGKDIAGNEGAASAKDIYELIKQGNGYTIEHRFEQAKSCYCRAREIDPENRTVLLELGRCYKLSGEYEKAVHTFALLLKQDINDSNIFTELDDVFISWNDPAKAVDFYTRLFKQYPSNHIKEKLGKALIVEADVLVSNNDSKKAIVFYGRAWALDPQNKGIYSGPLYNRAIAEGVSAGKKTNHQQQLFANLEKLARICRQENIPLIFSGYPQELSMPIQDVSGKYKISLVDHRRKFAELLRNDKEQKYFIKDGHCTAEGYRIVAENIAEKIIRFIEAEMPGDN